MIINVAICDDEKEFLDIIQKEVFRLAKDLDITIETYMYTDGNRLVELICNDKEHFDILFLDIDMPDISGLEVAEKLREKDTDILIIFISAHEHYVFKSIEYSPFRYIRKNRMSKEIPLAMKAACSILSNKENHYIAVKTESEEVKINHSDILYYETVARKVGIHLNNGEVLMVRKTIKELYDEINDKNFIRIHSGCVVNAKYIDKFSNYDITLDNSEKLIVSRTRVKNVKLALLNYWGDKV